MTEIKETGYILDKDQEMFLLKNIKSIKWELLEERLAVKPVIEEYCIFYNNDDLNKFEPWTEDCNEG